MISEIQACENVLRYVQADLDFEVLILCDEAAGMREVLRCRMARSNDAYPRTEKEIGVNRVCLVQRCGGRLRCESRLGRLTRVGVRLAEPLKMGLASVMGRFGVDVSSWMGEPTEVLSKAYSRYGFQGSDAAMLWPVDGELRVVKATIDDDGTPTEYFRRFIELFATTSEVRDTFLSAEIKEVRFPAIRFVIEDATVDEMKKLITLCADNNQEVSDVEKALTRWRDDDGPAITEIALSGDPAQWQHQVAVACAIIRLSEEGEEIPQELVDALQLERVRQLSLRIPGQDALNSPPLKVYQDDPNMVDKFISFADPAACHPPFRLTWEAMGALNEETRRRFIDRHLEEQGGEERVVPYLFLVHDPTLWKQVIEAMGPGSQDKVALALSLLPTEALPLLDEVRQSADEEKRRLLHRSMVILLARAAESGEFGEEQWDECLDREAFSLLDKNDSERYCLMKIIHRLPRTRAVDVLRARLEDPATFVAAFRLLGSHPQQELVELAFRTLLEREAEFKYPDNNGLIEGLRRLPNVRPWINWLLKNGAGSELNSVFSNVLGREELEAMKEELEKEGSEVSEKLDHIDKVVRLAREVGGSGQTIYLLRRLAEEPRRWPDQIR
ncbi:MAG: hypothetical protein ACNA8W_07455 [Bradymonadaceae bacterium]